MYYKNNPYLLMIRPNQWIKSNEYKNCTLMKINDKEYKFCYGTPTQYSSWVEIKRKNNLWAYYSLCNKSLKFKSYIWIGDLLDDVVENMVRAKL
jgi:hypothetical protein